MTWARVNAGKSTAVTDPGAASNTNTVTTASLTSGNRLFVIIYATYGANPLVTGGTVGVPTDGHNTYTLWSSEVQSEAGGSSFFWNEVAIYSAPITTGGVQTISVTVSGGSTDNALGLAYLEYSGLDSSAGTGAMVGSAGTTFAGASTTGTATTGTITGGAASQLVLSAATNLNDNNTTFTWNTGTPTETKIAAASFDATGITNGAVGEGTMATGTTCSANWSIGGGTDTGALSIVVAKLAAGALTHASGFPVNGMPSGAATSVPATWVTVGDAAILCIENGSSATSFISGVSSAKTTGWVSVHSAGDATTASTYSIWMGKITATGSDTLSIIWSGATPSGAGSGQYWEYVLDELVSGLGSTTVWSVVAHGLQESTASPWNWPQLTSGTPALQAYWGYGNPQNDSATGGTGTGFNFVVTTNFACVTCFNGALAPSTSYQPAMTRSANTSNFSVGVAGIISATLPVSHPLTVTSTVTSTSKALKRPSRKLTATATSTSAVTPTKITGGTSHPQTVAATVTSTSSVTPTKLTRHPQTVVASVTSTSSVTPTKIPGAPTYVKDTFTDTNGTGLAAHTPDIGGAWASSIGAIQSNRLQPNFFNQGFTNNATQAPSADYDVSIDVVMVAASLGQDRLGVIGRANLGGGAWYAAYYDAVNQRVALSNYVSASETVLGTFALTYVQGQTHNVKLRMQGTTISCLVDGVTQISVTDVTHTFTDNLGIHLGDNDDTLCLAGDNFLAAGIPPPAPVTHPQTVIANVTSTSTVTPTKTGTTHPLTVVAAVTSTSTASAVKAHPVTTVATVTSTSNVNLVSPIHVIGAVVTSTSTVSAIKLATPHLQSTVAAVTTTSRLSRQIGKKVTATATSTSTVSAVKIPAGGVTHPVTTVASVTSSSDVSMDITIYLPRVQVTSSSTVTAPASINRRTQTTVATVHSTSDVSMDIFLHMPGPSVISTTGASATKNTAGPTLVQLSGRSTGHGGATAHVRQIQMFHSQSAGHAGAQGHLLAFMPLLVQLSGRSAGHGGATGRVISFIPHTVELQGQTAGTSRTRAQLTVGPGGIVTPTTLAEHIIAAAGMDPAMLGATGYGDELFTTRLVGDTT